MSRISFRDNGEEHNFWQNYTDLMSGLLIVFIIASLVTYTHFKGISDGNSDEIKVKVEQYKKIKAFLEAQKTITRKYFRYNEEYQRFECTVGVMFKPKSADIPLACKPKLKEAGRVIDSIINEFSESTNVSFKVVIEGRAAQPSHITPGDKAYAAQLSYERARNLHLFWTDNGLLTNIEKRNGEVIISGSGFDGKGRYSGSDEDSNKTVIIQIIPCITFDNK